MLPAQFYLDLVFFNYYALNINRVIKYWDINLLFTIHLFGEK